MNSQRQDLRILLLYVGDVSGHRQGARAIKQAFQKDYPWIKVKEVNIFRHGNPFIRCSLDSLYYALIKLTPWFWDIIWDSKEVYWLTYLLRYLLYRMNYHRLYREVIKPFDPQVVVCTHSLSCAISSTIKSEKNLNFLLVAVPTDFYLNTYCFYIPCLAHKVRLYNQYPYNPPYNLHHYPSHHHIFLLLLLFQKVHTFLSDNLDNN